MSAPDAAADFTRAWHTDAPRVLAYARRHVPHDRAQDVVAEAFTVAWRRWHDVPAPPLPWLIATARNLVRAERRDLARRLRLDDRLALLREVAAPADGAGDEVLVREEALATLAGLDEDHREALLLVAWDGLDAAGAAEVLGIRPGAFRTRLHRARRALERAERGPAPPAAYRPAALAVTTPQETA